MTKRTIDISILQQELDNNLCKSLLFIHAISGCDTTSRPYGIGKTSAMNKYHELQEHAKIFMMPSKTHKEIEQAGHHSLVALYGCLPGTELNFERAARFSSKVVTSSSHLPPEKLPPTMDAAKFHSYRVYHQIQVWLGNNLDPLKWGWNMQKTQRGEILKPLRMEQAPAPTSLLNLIKCNCRGQCDRNTCTCRKHGLTCTLACRQCKGISCTNVSPVEMPIDDNVDDS